MGTILLADDEARIRRLVSDFLKRDGHKIVEAVDGGEAVALFDSKPSHYDLIILDVMMPVYDGFAVLKHIREINSSTPVMMLTARAEDIDEVYGLSAGADDYVTKPFSPVVLVARAKTLMQRYGKPTDLISIYGNMSIDETRREVKVIDTTIDLTPKEYELLIYFKNNKNIALSRESILNSVWGYDYFGDLRTVDTHVKKLRAKLGECCNLIETVRGYGYRFEV